MLNLGTFAKVALCVDLVTKEERAVKIFEKKSLLESTKPNRTKVALLNEIDIMKKIKHPNIIRLYEIYEG